MKRLRDMALLEFDEQAAALYLKLRQGKVASTEPLAENVIVDLDSKGKLLGLELLLSPQMKPETRRKLLEAI